jgi:hypothetical protein
VRQFLQERPLGNLLLGALLTLVGIVGLLIIAYYLVQDVSIWVFGRHAEAEVLDLWVEQTNQVEEGELTFQYFVKYAFMIPSGEIFVGSSTVAGLEWGALSIGGPIDIVYFALYPAHSRLDESRFVSVLACAYVPLLTLTWVCLAIGWYLLDPRRGKDRWFGRWLDRG